MPCLEDHCKRSVERYGKRFDYMHKWLDESCMVLGPIHRRYFRHNVDDLNKKAHLLFPNKSNEERILFRDVIADHILYDLMDTEGKRVPKQQKQTIKVDNVSSDSMNRLVTFINREDKQDIALENGISIEDVECTIQLAKLILDNRIIGEDKCIAQGKLDKMLKEKCPIYQGSHFQSIQNYIRNLQRAGVPVMSSNQGSFLAITKEDILSVIKWRKTKLDSDAKNIAKIEKILGELNFGENNVEL